MRSGVPVAPPEVGLGTRTVVIAAIDPTFHTTVSKARHLMDAFSFGDGLIRDGLLRKLASLRAIMLDEQRRKKKQRRHTGSDGVGGGSRWKLQGCELYDLEGGWMQKKTARALAD